MKRQTRTLTTPRPFLKWVGGKGQLLPELLGKVDAAGRFARYHEPFVGGGALFFELVRTGRIGRKQAYLSDTNANLIDAYHGVADHVNEVIGLLREHRDRHSEEHYYAVRSQRPQSVPERAARIIYLNKTCYNGLFRENSKGQFNTPFGRYKNPMICDEPNLRAVSEALKKARIEQRPFETVLDRATPGDLVYFDPPYHPVSKTASFTRYDRNGFDEEAQAHLARTFKELAGRGVNAILSNSYTDFIRELYREEYIHVDEVFAKRNVNSRADRRGKVSEALIWTFQS